jgi:hypothetical protein
MKTTLALVLVLAASGALPGCRSMGDGAATGAAVGGLLGAGGGYAIGHHRGNTTNYALAIGAAGALAGYLVGDQWDHHQAAAQAGPPSPTPVTSYAPPPQPAYIVRERVAGPCCDPLPPGW